MNMKVKVPQEELNEILVLHQIWLDDEPEGKQANLMGYDLRGADLSDVNLRLADLYNSDLRGADLHGADLSRASLRDADLRGADLRDADLRGADLRDAGLGWINWHEVVGLKVYGAQLNSSRENAQLVYIPSLDVATTGCWQDSWEKTKKRVEETYKDRDNSIYKKYQLAFKYIEDQIEADDE